MDKLHMKFSALNADFDGPSLNFLGSGKPAHEGIKEQYPDFGLQNTFQEQIAPKAIEVDMDKLHYFTVVGQSFVKTVADHHLHAAYHNKH